MPIWKSTYRLVLPDDGRKPMLQGWAVVDNTLGQDWTNVELSLVAGAPQSFVQQISQPYYVQRPVVPLPPAVLLQPQTHAGTLIDRRAGGQARRPSAESVTVTTRVRARRRGRRRTADGLRGRCRRRDAVSSTAAAGARHRLQAPLSPAAQAQELGELFEYKLRQPITFARTSRRWCRS